MQWSAGDQIPLASEQDHSIQNPVSGLIKDSSDGITSGSGIITTGAEVKSSQTTKLLQVLYRAGNVEQALLFQVTSCLVAVKLSRGPR